MKDTKAYFLSKPDLCRNCEKAGKCLDLKTRPENQRTIVCVKYIERR